MCSGYYSLIKYMICNHSPISWLPFYSWHFLLVHKFLNFHEVQLTGFFLLLPVHLVSYPRNLRNPVL